MKKKVSLIGFGNVGKKYFDMIKKDKRLKLVSIVDKKKIYKKNIDFFHDYKEMMRTIKADILIIATNVDERAKIIMEAKQYKFQNIICEKPIVKNYNELTKIKSLFKYNNPIIHTHYTRRYLKEFNQLKFKIQNARNNKILFSTFYYTKGIFHNGVHFLDYVISLFGYPRKTIVISKKKSKTLKNDFLVDFVIYFSNFKIYFISFESGKLASSDFKIVSEKSKIEVTSKRTIEYYIRGKNKLFNNLDEYKLLKSTKINYKKSFKNIINSVYSKKHFSNLKREIEIYSLINNLLKKKKL